MDQRIISLWDDYRHVHLDRRVFMDRLVKLTGGTAAAFAALPTLENNYAQAAQVQETDERIKTSRVKFPGAGGDVAGYLAVPATGGKHGAVIVIHQNRGLNPHIEDVARRIAVAGFVALAPDFLSPLGGTPKNDDAAAAMFSKLDLAQVDKDAVAAARWLKMRPEANGKVGAVGFCWGGNRVGQLAVLDPDLKAVVIYYGVAPDPRLAGNIKAELLINMPDPELDPRTTGSMPPFVAALKAAKVPYQIYYYPGANHGFNDDTAGVRYDEGAAKLAWERTLELFKKDLA